MAEDHRATPTRALTLQVNSPWLRSLAPGQLDLWLDIMARASVQSAELGVDQLAAWIGRSLDAAGIRHSAMTARNFAEQFADSVPGELTVIDDEGRVLHPRDEA